MQAVAAPNHLKRPLIADAVSAEVPLARGQVLTLHSTYPYANLGQLVRNLVASHHRLAGAAAAERLRQDLLRQPAARTADSLAPAWLRGFVLVREQQTGRIASAGVFHAELQLSFDRPSSIQTPLALTASVRMGSCHLSSKAQEVGATQPAAQLFAGVLLRKLSFACKDIFMAERRTVSLDVNVEFPEAGRVELKKALSQGLVRESWRISGWRAAPLSL